MRGPGQPWAAGVYIHVWALGFHWLRVLQTSESTPLAASMVEVLHALGQLLGFCGPQFLRRSLETIEPILGWT